MKIYDCYSLWSQCFAFWFFHFIPVYLHGLVLAFSLKNWLILWCNEQNKSVSNIFTFIHVHYLRNILSYFVSSGIPAEVPLWLGLNLRQRGKCRIVMPDWLDEEKLSEKKEEETQSKVYTVHILLESMILMCELNRVFAIWLFSIT